MDIDWHAVFECREGVLISRSTGKAYDHLPNGRRYIHVPYKGKAYPAHRVIWEMFNGPIPEGLFIDHIDRDKLNNKLDNLRLVDKTQNAMNCALRKNSVTPIKNVYRCNHGKRWRVYVKAYGVRYNGGSYKDLELAELVAHELREKIHGEFACHD
jgi:hypothetical protein